MTNVVPNPLADDLNHILTHTRDLWEEMRGQRIFITGSTGFFGCWLLESFAWANDRLKLDASSLVLSRNPQAFEKKAPHLYHHPAIRLHKGDVQDFDYPPGRFSHLIHGAVYQQPAGKKPGNFSLANEMLTGTRRVLDFCAGANIGKMLLISTGAVYGKAPDQMKKIPEDFSGSFDPTDSARTYHHVRRMMESLSVLYAQEYDFEAKIARCFSFIGPYLPLDGRFAVSDFILDALSERSITVKGDGKSVRTYLYMADLVKWLWRILFIGDACKPYNVGSELPVSIRQLAEAFAEASNPPLGISILNHDISGVAQNHYVPDTEKARLELGLQQHIPLAVAIQKTLKWFGWLECR